MICTEVSAAEPRPCPRCGLLYGHRYPCVS